MPRNDAPRRIPARRSRGGLAALAACALLAAALAACHEADMEPAPPAAPTPTPAPANDDKSEWPADKEDWGEWADDKEEWDDDKRVSPGEALEETARLMEEAGADVLYVEHAGRGDRTVLAAPRDFADGRTPLIVSLHGYGGNSAGHAEYIPLHEHMNADGFALLLPNGALDAEGNPFWNPTERDADSGKGGGDDVAYLTELVAEARRLRDFGPVYVFGYSNGGFMAHYLACRGMLGLRAVASLAGTSYVDVSACGAPPVSTLHVHGTDDDVILFEGDRDPEAEDEPAFYAGAWELARAWSARAGCAWPDDPRPYASHDYDRYVGGAETRAYRLESGCAGGAVFELWAGEGSSHGPGYGDAFVGALAGWLLSR